MTPQVKRGFDAAFDRYDAALAKAIDDMQRQIENDAMADAVMERASAALKRLLGLFWRPLRGGAAVTGADAPARSWLALCGLGRRR